MTDSRPTIPSVNRLVEQAEAAGLLDRAPRTVIVNSARAVLQAARASHGREPEQGWLGALELQVGRSTQPTLRPVINATGVVIHTNLGRAPLPAAAVEAVTRIGRYNTLEYSLETGTRGSRQDHLRGLLCEITGAEDGLVLNNAAAALVVVLNSIAAGGESIVSRGELVEIGGAFRIPDIMARSGTTLVEVGTTNRTRIEDYEAALTERTRCALKVHRSNFTISGFTCEATVEQLATRIGGHDIPILHDIGSGLLIDLEAYGLRGEPIVQDSVAHGTIAVFSGDKLLGGPQAGIIVGPAALVRRIAQNPLARATRPDKIVLAALEATLELYRDRETALREIPVLAMLTADAATIAERAGRLAAGIDGAFIEPGTSSVGGGSFPDAELVTTLVAVETEHPDRFLEQLRRGDPPVIARAAESRILLDPRTVTDEEVADTARVVGAALR